MNEIFRAVNQNGVELLLPDLDLALTFMDVGDTSHIEETKQRYRDSARKAYDAVLRLLKKLSPDTGQRHAMTPSWPF